MDIKKLIFIGGVAWLASKWATRSVAMMKKMGLVYGDHVDFVKRNSNGVEQVVSGKLVNKNGIPMVLLDSPVNGANIIPWEPNIGKSVNK